MPINALCIFAPICFSIYPVTGAVIAVVIKAFRGLLALRLPLVFLALANISLRGAVAIVTSSCVAVAVDSIWILSVPFEVVGVFSGCSTQSIHINVVEKLNCSTSPIIVVSAVNSSPKLINEKEEVKNDGVPKPVAKAC